MVLFKTWRRRVSGGLIMDYIGHCTAMFGTNGTGKTRAGIKLIKSKQYKAVLFIVSDDDEPLLRDVPKITLDQLKIGLKTGVAKHICDDVNELFPILFDKFKGVKSGDKYFPVCLFVDDAMSILTARNPLVMDYFKKRRQKIADIIINAHGASEFPISLYFNLTNIYIFQTLDSWKKLTNRMNEQLTAVFVSVANYVFTVAEHGIKNNNELKYFYYNFKMKQPPTMDEIKIIMESQWWLKYKSKNNNNGTLKNAPKKL